MKTLYFKNGTSAYCLLSKGDDVKFISVYNDEKQLLYAVCYSDFPTRHKVIFAEGISELAFYEIQQINEIIENFNQYFNLLNQ